MQNFNLAYDINRLRQDEVLRNAKQARRVSQLKKAKVKSNSPRWIDIILNYIGLAMIRIGKSIQDISRDETDTMQYQDC